MFILMVLVIIVGTALDMETPPVGTVLNVAASVSRISVDDAFGGGSRS